MVAVVVAEVLGNGAVVERGGSVGAVPTVDGARGVVAAAVCCRHLGVFVETGRGERSQIGPFLLRADWF